ncbi:MAG: molybdenum cofactor biosynthesis protein MoaE, partial [Gammaproteobacteria bacterium]|nr:molybdenum cofactor biosynthesis protein MoaE [Gammaproteobacteria bacterium]
MNRFGFSRGPVDLVACRARLADPAAGAYASFEGWVRNHNEGRAGVLRLEYEGYEQLGVKEGERIIAEALARFEIADAQCP